MQSLKSLVKTLVVFFTAVFLLFLVDVKLHGTVTGKGIAALLVICLVSIWAHRRKMNRLSEERDREERLCQRAHAMRLVELYRRRLHGESGESESDCLDLILLLISIILIVMAITTGMSHASTVDETTLWQHQNQQEVGRILTDFSQPPRVSSFPLPKSKVEPSVPVSIPSAGGLLLTGLICMVVMRRKGGTS